MPNATIVRGLGLFSLVVGLALGGCADVGDDAEFDEDDDDDDVEVMERGFVLGNGLKLANGLSLVNGLKLANGVSLASGLAVGNGLSTASGLNTAAGLSTTAGFMTSTDGQKLIQYLVECALPNGQNIVKANPLAPGQNITFYGKVGLGSNWRTGACDSNCQTWVSACLLARTNAEGKTVQIDMRGSHAAIGTTSTSPLYYVQEAAFYGNLFSNPPKYYACKGRDATFGMYEGRTCSNPETCGFQVPGNCFHSPVCKKGSDKTYKDCVGGGTTYANVITTYLDPTPFGAGCPAGCDACSVEDNTCTQFCTNGQPCSNQTLTCPAGWECEVLCDGPNTCKSTTVQGANATHVTVDCVDGTACQSAIVNCSVGDCDVACDGIDACKSTTLKVTGAGDGFMQCNALSSGEILTDAGAGTIGKSGC